MAAKAAIERAHNELARFVEREQARQDVSIHSFDCFTIIVYRLFLCILMEGALVDEVGDTENDGHPSIATIAFRYGSVWFIFLIVICLCD
jgi:hypothetical protein